MERRIFFILLLVVLSMGWIYFQGWKVFDSVVGTRDNLYNEVIPKKSSDNSTIRVSDYTVSWFKVEDVNKLSLFPNFEEKTTAREAMTEHSCKSLVNAGFYSKEGKPIGLFVANDRKLSNQSSNYLFDGVFEVTKDGIVKITRENAFEPARFAVQAGPVLIKDGQTQEMKVKGDEGKRRMVVALNQIDEIFFLSIYKEDSAYLGPVMADLPEIVKSFGEKKNVQVTNALNLDGGAASAFLTDSISLGELTPIGSYFCITR